MANEQIGLEAVFKDAGFQAGIKKYQGSVDTANAKTGKFTDTIKNSASKIPGLGSALSLLTNPITLVTAGIGAMTAITMKSVNETVAYNKEIREMTQVTGLGAEEISRIVQVGDDWGISMGTIRSALQMMNRKGITPSVENLAILADEYAVATDKSKFMEEATKKYGRSVVELIPILAKGGKELRDQAAAIDENMLATEESIKASRDYEVAVDKLTDTWQGLKYEIGNNVIPVLTDLLDATGDLVDKNKEITKTAESLEIAFNATMLTEEQYIDLRHRLMYETDSLAAVQLELAAANRDVFDAATMAYPEEERFIGLYNDLKVKTVELDEAQEGLAGAIGNLSGAFDEAKATAQLYKEGLNAVSSSMVEQERITLVLAIATGDLSAAEIKEKLDALDRLAAMESLNKALQDGTIDHYQWLGALADGNVTQSEVNALLGITSDELGEIYNQTTALDGMTAEVTVNTYLNTFMQEFQGDRNRAEGGPVTAGHPYIVGERGPEPFIPSTNGVILPNSMMSNYSVSTNNNRNVSINMGGVNITNGADHQAFISQVEWAVKRSLGV